MSYRRKLIEVALPLEAINKEAAREKTIRHGHPSTLHLWWARRPLAACRAVLFASLVDDPDEPQAPAVYLEQLDALSYPGDRREKLFAFIEDLVKWDNSDDERIIGTARRLILAATEGNPPPGLDPFCGGGAIPLEAQRLGLEAHGSDLNPVAVLITKALIEIPPKFAGMPPVNPEAQQTKDLKTWTGLQGLAEDVRYYGRWMRDEAETRIGHLYPKGPNGEKVIAWLWARTVKCPNPACRAEMPLVSSFWLAKRPSNATWMRVNGDVDTGNIAVEVCTGTPTPEERPQVDFGTRFVNEAGKRVMATFRCVCCHLGVAKGDYIDMEAQAGRMGFAPLAVVAEGAKGRMYLPFSEEHLEIALQQARNCLEDPRLSQMKPMEPSRGTMASNAQSRGYGFSCFADYFTARQLVALTTFCNLVQETRHRVIADAATNRLTEDGTHVHGSETGVDAYADAVATYLGLMVDKLADLSNSLCRWEPIAQCPRQLFGRQAIPMVWDFAEGNPLGASSGSWSVLLDNLLRSFSSPLFAHDRPLRGQAVQLDASAIDRDHTGFLICTDPPYYDNIGYADLSDFFYVWLRRSLGATYPGLLSTVLTPKATELVADPFRFNYDWQEASRYFEEGLSRVFDAMRKAQCQDYPLTVFYAFKQDEQAGPEQGTINSAPATGWETMLGALLRAGFAITGTWPIRTEMKSRQIAMGTNALASSIVLVCRPRPADAPMATRREFLNALKKELPDALRQLQKGNIAPVDLAQASIGPGMAVFSRYSKVLETDGSAMRIGTALGLINQTLDEVLSEQEGEFDADTRWALAWFEQHGFTEGVFGDAETLSTAKNTSVRGMEEAGILLARAGKVRLLGRSELQEDWDPATDRRFTIWEATQYLIRALEQQGEMGAATLLRRLGSNGEVARDLAYRLYHICERKGWAQDAIGCNSLVVAWPEIQRLASHLPEMQGDQSSLF